MLPFDVEFCTWFVDVRVLSYLRLGNQQEGWFPTLSSNEGELRFGRGANV